ncbi:ParA family protein [Devosia sp. FJ2-5-3]|uniref:ParA family protein n=1 Tax=Devosia sp. FJ2-5-3 TaxID=2976680 RepID=UPI0023D7D5CB|nr:ParA family protein [Devosia sp. FJ2-5-3]WEJ59197.1 ParA family protein [Devosia sp. FJ2-5-3]
MTATLVVSNRKGGTGKTTVSVNIAAELAARGQRVLLVDLDTQGHCAVGLGVSVSRSARTAHDLFRSAEATLAGVVVPTSCERLALAPADRLFHHGQGLQDEGILRRAIGEDAIQRDFDVVIIDTPPSLDALLINGLVAADWLLVPFVPHPLAGEGIKQLMRILLKVITESNHELKIAGFLPVMSNDRIRLHRSVGADVSLQFGAFKVLPPVRNDIRLAEAFALGQPVRYTAPSSRAASDFAEIGDIVARRCLGDTAGTA